MTGGGRGSPAECPFQERTLGFIYLAPQTPPPPPLPRGRLSFSWCISARLLLECVLLLERVLLRECTSEYWRAVSAASLSFSLSLSLSRSLSLSLSLSDLQSSSITVSLFLSLSLSLSLSVTLKRRCTYRPSVINLIVKKLLSFSLLLSHSLSLSLSCARALSLSVGRQLDCASHGFAFAPPPGHPPCPRPSTRVAYNLELYPYSKAMN